jgi:hypothetical protein
MNLGKINTHLLQDLTVLAKANQKGSVVYISSDKKIHSGTIFQKLSAFISRYVKDKSLAPNDLKNDHTEAKKLVIDNLKNQMKIYFYIKNKEISQDLDSYISEFSERLVTRITDPKSSISNKKEILSDFKEVLENLSSITTDSTEIKSLRKSFFHTFILSESSIKEKSKFKFLALQFNEILNKDQSNVRSTDFNEIDLISQNALWIKKNKWIDSNRALSLGKEMARDELKDLTNNEKFDVLQKTLKSFEGKDINYYDENFSKKLEQSAQIIKDKKIVKEFKINEKVAKFKESLSSKEKSFFVDENIKKVFIANKDRELTNDQVHILYGRILVEEK